MAAGEVLFGSVPADVFRIFAGPARAFYADLLTHLSEDLFGQSGEVSTRRRVIETIAEFIDRTGRLPAFDLASEEAVSTGPSHFAIYDRLLQTGWLVEHRDRYRKVVDFESSARLVLQALLDIRAGRARSYGGAVLNVLTLLQSVESDPAERALNVREAGLAARSFMNHLRSVAGSMRNVEAQVRHGYRDLQRRLDDDQLILDLQDYRKFFDFDLAMTNDRAQETTLSRRAGTGSGAQKQAPYYVAVGAAMAAAYYPKSGAGEPDGLGLVVFDEAFNNLDAPNTDSILVACGSAPFWKVSWPALSIRT